MSTDTHCPVCRIRKLLRRGLEHLKPQPLQLRVAAALPLPFRKQVSGRLSVELFQEEGLCRAAYVGSAGRQHVETPGFEFRLGLCADDKRQAGESETT